VASWSGPTVLVLGAISTWRVPGDRTGPGFPVVHGRLQIDRSGFRPPEGLILASGPSFLSVILALLVDYGFNWEHVKDGLSRGITLVATRLGCCAHPP